MKVLQDHQINTARDVMNDARQTNDTLLANARMQREVMEDLFDRVAKVLEQVEYREDWQVTLTVEHNQLWMQVRFWRKDVISGLYDWGYGGKAAITEQITTSQIVQMAFGLIKATEEHECREHFLYLGERVFGPHIDIHALVEVATDTDHEFGTR